MFPPMPRMHLGTDLRPGGARGAQKGSMFAENLDTPFLCHGSVVWISFLLILWQNCHCKSYACPFSGNLHGTACKSSPARAHVGSATKFYNAAWGESVLWPDFSIVNTCHCHIQTSDIAMHTLSVMPPVWAHCTSFSLETMLMNRSWNWSDSG